MDFECPEDLYKCKIDFLLKKLKNKDIFDNNMDKIIELIKKYEVDLHNKESHCGNCKDSVTKWNFIKNKVQKSCSDVVSKGKISWILFRTAIIISLFFILFLIPSVYLFFEDQMPTTWIRLIILFIFFVAIVFIVERVSIRSG